MDRSGKQKSGGGELARKCAERPHAESGGLAALGVADTDMSSAPYGGEAVGLSRAEHDGLPLPPQRRGREHGARAPVFQADQAKLAANPAKLEYCYARRMRRQGCVPGASLGHVPARAGAHRLIAADGASAPLSALEAHTHTAVRDGPLHGRSQEVHVFFPLFARGAVLWASWNSAIFVVWARAGWDLENITEIADSPQTCRFGTDADIPDSRKRVVLGPTPGGRRAVAIYTFGAQNHIFPDFPEFSFCAPKFRISKHMARNV